MISWFNRILKRFLIWRLRHVSDQRFVLVLSVVIGFFAGLAAVIIKNLVHLIQHLLTHQFTVEIHNYLFFIYPAIGILLTIIFTKYIIKRRVGHGVPSTLYAISKNNGIMRAHNMFSSIVSSVLTVGFGGSAGLEGPTVATGSAIGSNLGKLLHLDYRKLALLMACASAAAMASIFKAPIAAIVFVLEVIMLDLTMTSVLPVLLASVSGVLTSYLFLGQNVILHVVDLKERFQLIDTPYFIILGILCGLLSLYFTKTYLGITAIFDKREKTFPKFIFGAILLGILIFIMPSLYGEGYESINSALRGDYSFLTDQSLFYQFRDNFFVIVLLFVGLLLLKVVATTVTFSIGGVGGIFAPTLFMGSVFGLFYAVVLNQLNVQIDFTNFALAGMAGLIAGVLHAPLTAIFLIAEITSGYALFIPLMIVSTISYATIMYFEPNSVYTYQLAKRGQLLTHHKDKAVLSLMKLEKLIETNFKTVHPDSTLGDLVNVIKISSRNIFPVVDHENNFIGLVKLDDIRDIIFRPDQYDTILVKNVMIIPEYTVSIDEPMEDVAQKFQKSGRFNIAVLKDGKYLGFVSRAKVFSSYRKMLKDFSEH